MKKILGIICSILVIVIFTGCRNNNLDSGNKLETKGNCIATECIKKINVDNTVEQINDIIGLEGKLVDENSNKYYWQLSETSGIEITYYSSKNGTIKLDVDKNIFSNKNVDFSRYNELQTKIKDGITYNEFINYIGNVEGTLIEKSSSSSKYIWVNESGNYLNGTFSNSSGKCLLTTGMIKE